MVNFSKTRKLFCKDLWSKQRRSSRTNNVSCCLRTRKSFELFYMFAREQTAVGGITWRWRNIEYVENNSRKLIIISFNTWDWSEKLATCPFYFRVAKHEKFEKFLVWLALNFSTGCSMLNGMINVVDERYAGSKALLLPKQHIYPVRDELYYFIAFSIQKSGSLKRNQQTAWNIFGRGSWSFTQKRFCK